MMAIGRELYQYNYYQEGTIPDIIVTVPTSWTPAQIAEFQASFDFLLQGNAALKSKVRFMPGDTKPFSIKEPILKGEYDEWLVRIMCFAFSISPVQFVSMMNRATSETSKQAADEEGLMPLQTWFKDEIMDPIIQEPMFGFGWADIEFVYTQEEELDHKDESIILVSYVKEGIMTRAEAREDLGLDPISGADELTVDSKDGPIKLSDLMDGTIAPPNSQAEADIKTKSAVQVAKAKPAPVAGAPGKKSAGKSVKKAAEDETEADPVKKKALRYSSLASVRRIRIKTFSKLSKK